MNTATQIQIREAARRPYTSIDYPVNLHIGGEWALGWSVKVDHQKLAFGSVSRKDQRAGLLQAGRLS